MIVEKSVGLDSLGRIGVEDGVGGEEGGLVVQEPQGSGLGTLGQVVNGLSQIGGFLFVFINSILK